MATSAMDPAFRRLDEEHVRAARLFTGAASERTHVIDYGVLSVDERSRLASFEEKPTVTYPVTWEFISRAWGTLLRAGWPVIRV